MQKSPFVSCKMPWSVFTGTMLLSFCLNIIFWVHVCQKGEKKTFERLFLKIWLEKGICVSKLYTPFVKNRKGGGKKKSPKRQLGLFVCGVVRYLDTVLSKHFLSGVCFHIVLIGKVFLFMQVLNRTGHAQVFVYSLAGSKGLERQAVCCHGFQFSSACLKHQG